ncbi:MAG TPA: sensor histidine kinase, partial [Balneolales bacterium]|nr:sensor histidine kinase [Balneolales bacterium]
ERTRSDLEKKNFNNHLRRLYHKLDSIREEESKRIAREIHDNLGQVLTTLKIELSLLDNKLMKKNNDVADSMSMMFSLLEKNMEVVRDISRELRPPVLDYMNLTKAIEWQGELFQEKTGVKFSLHTVPSKIDLDEHRSTTLFRIFQECLTNITRHSKASEVCVQIFLRDGNLMMQVIDNGIGITDEEVNSTRSLGILGMKERAQVWSGEVDLVGGKGEGTTVTIQIKCDSNV